jgi:hypothetical protein
METGKNARNRADRGEGETERDRGLARERDNDGEERKQRGLERGDVIG